MVVLCAYAKNNHTVFATERMEPILDATWTVEQVMMTYPKTVTFFLALKTDCVGCQLERFCLLEEVAVTYKLPLGILLEKLYSSIQISIQ